MSELCEQDIKQHSFMVSAPVSALASFSNGTETQLGQHSNIQYLLTLITIV